ncbi:MAG: hypothetical protein AABZ06_00220 [Bdellovibrionota bacterium]
MLKRASGIIFLSLLLIGVAGATTWALADPSHPGPGHGNNPPHNPPAPSPIPPSQPTPDVSKARHEGHADGNVDGAREGRVRGPVEGESAGRDCGYREGYARCERDGRRHAYDSGYREGFIRGELEGQTFGSRQGDVDGQLRGTSEGRLDGEQRADRDAFAEATPLGREKGRQEAEASDAAQRGDADGTVAGDKEAFQKAQAEDYPRGRKYYRDERYAEPIENEDSFFNKLVNGVARVFGKPAFNAKTLSLNALNIVSTQPGATPDHRFYNPRRTYPTPDENNAYRSGYDQGYNSGFSSTYQSSYSSAYNMAYRHGEEHGCREAKHKDYRLDFERGFVEGKSVGYNRAYQLAYDQAYRYAYNASFSTASDQAYRNSYQMYYQRHFESARAAAYAERVNELYRRAFNSAKKAKFNEMYPIYASQEFDRGKQDEARDFDERPVRLLNAEVMETIPNNLYEPGEPLRLKIKMRNFADVGLDGRDVKVKLQALDGASSIIAESETNLSRDLMRKSRTTVSGLLDFSLTEDSVGEAKSFRITLFCKGRVAGEQVVVITPMYMVAMAFAEPPVLREGLESALKLRLKNQSSVATDSGFLVNFKSSSQLIEIVRPQVNVGVLNPGEERVIEFVAIGRETGNAKIPVAFEGVSGTGRRIGLMDEIRDIPVMNDYVIDVVSGATSLRMAGISRVEYKIRNVSSRLILKTLQLKIRIKAKEGDPFAVLGPNPQYLSPILNGQTSGFVAPVLVRGANSGGTIELEVQESGRTVVLHREDF